MSFIKNNIWGVGFAAILIGAFIVMAFASKNSGLPSPRSVAEDQVDFEIVADDHIKGNPDAKVTLIEFADFQCPACGAYNPVVDELSKEFPNDLRVIYRHFPLRAIHFQAENAAKASEAAALQGKFAEMHDLLFAEQNSWARTSGTEVFSAYAETLGLDIERFENDIKSDAVLARVRRDSDFGLDIGLNSTPSFYLQGKKIGNPPSYEAFKALIETEIANANVL